MPIEWTYYVWDNVFTSEVRAIYRLSHAWVVEAWTGDGWARTSRSIRNDQMDLTKVDEATAVDLTARFRPGAKGVLAPWAAGGEYGAGLFNRRSPLLKDD